VAVVVVAATGVVQLRQVSPQVHATMTFLQGLALLIVPLVLSVTAFQNRVRKAEMIDAMMRMPRPSTPESVQAALRATLHDDSVEVLFWVPETHSLVDLSGQPVLAPDPGPRFQAALHGSGGQPLGLITADPRLANHERLVDTVVSAATLEIENAALHTALLTQVEQPHDSSSLKAEGAEAERRRLERDLHDGAQQHMLAVALRVEHARQQATDTDTLRSLGLIGSELQRALAEMRDLAHGLRPQALDSGLGPALARLARGMSVPVRVDAEPQSLDREAETTAYFVVCEALSNVTKHAHATHVSVCVRSIGDQLLLSVTDDGTGGARPASGSGLQGLVARVEGSGGQVRIISPPGRGTRIEARIPCG
jgi:signal transduction histidine kinase